MLFRSADQNPWVDAHGNPAVVPAGYGGVADPYSQGYGGCPTGGCPNGGCYDGGGGYCDGSGYGGGGGCDGMSNGARFPATDQMMDAFGGGMNLNTEQCGPHYFDFAVEWVLMQRTSVGNSSTPISQDNLGGPIVLTSGDGNPNMESGFRLTGRYDVGALSFVEVAYTGLFDMDGSASVRDENGTGDLYTPFTAFGTNPADLDANPQFDGTDRALEHRVYYDAELQTAEISYRRYWVGYSPRVTGTLLWGFRFTKLNERYGFQSQGSRPVAPATPASAEFLVVTDNNLAGAQVGGDGWVTIRQGLRIGGEAKVGLYGNHYTIDYAASQNNFFAGMTPINDDVVAFIGDFRVMMVADLFPSVSLKASYDVLVMNSLALAADNFTFQNQLLAGSTAVSNQGSAVYNGASFGIEYIW
ncbi:hypothetical protein Pla175_39920 [Pirellulimonas nuda]|uniref:Uncharacterized protein n=1 Tax=Pirellulimonas nuda TaxID=2528009 RepID=A0A518DGJ0_9BACT|nr:hypothetical protein [Pirellulimonas nuda]QDU90585.1 hypothetical protein Pla175_39920 [Pirellulimonas nuda]